VRQSSLTFDREQLDAEVLEALENRGQLGRPELAEAWGLEDGEVLELIERLALDRNVERVPGRGSGLRWRSRRGRLPDDTESDELLLASDWEREVVELLVARLAHQELERLLPDLLQTLRHLRKQQTGQDRRGTKRELATALVLRHGLDLLGDTAVRSSIARAQGIESPGRWIPGKGAARRFVRDAGLPDVLAGSAIAGRPEAVELIEPRVNLPGLADFRDEIKKKIYPLFCESRRRFLVTLPTGAGKTRVAVDAIADWLRTTLDDDGSLFTRRAAVWLAHTEELCEQAFACFRQVWMEWPAMAPLQLVRLWGDHLRGTDDLDAVAHSMDQVPTVLLSTPQRMLSLLDGKIADADSLLGAITGKVRLIVIDEAHRAATPSYRAILERTTGGGTMATHVEREVGVLGLTATPFRKEYAHQDPEEGTRQLREIFGELIEPVRTLGADARKALQERSVLARPQWRSIETNTSVRLRHLDGGRDPATELLAGEQADRVLAQRADNNPRRLLMLDELRAICADETSRVLYFGPTVHDAECMTFLLRREGIRAAVLSGDTRAATRRQVVRDFRAGRLKVLCNCQVLTTGFDDPQVSHVVMGRPTVSRVLYEQMVGRGLRGPKFGGTEVCHIIDCQDRVTGWTGELGYQSFRRVWGKDDG
jgi:superfamily II DNA or RNA helicase